MHAAAHRDIGHAEALAGEIRPIRELRLKHGLTLEGLGAKIDSSKSYVWEIENKDVARPSAEKLSLIAAATTRSRSMRPTTRRSTTRASRP